MRCDQFARTDWTVLLLAWFIGIERHYQDVARQTALSTPLKTDNIEPPVIVVVMRQWSILLEKALRFALSLLPPIIAVHANVSDDDPFERNWHRTVEAPIGRIDRFNPRLVWVCSLFQRFFHSMFDRLKHIEDDYPDRMIAVVMPELVDTDWHDHFSNNQRSIALKVALFLWDGELNLLECIRLGWRLDAGVSAKPLLW